MRIGLKQLKHLSVETVSGQQLGHVADLVFEICGQMIVQYIVRFSVLSTKEYVISRDQIVNITKEKIIVDNSVCIGSEKKEEKITQMPEPVVMIEEI